MFNLFKMFKNKSLPNKPSELIRLAINDFQKAKESKHYKIDMRIYHDPNGQCSVCLAGSVMAFSLGADRHKAYDSSDFKDYAKLKALDHFRSGEIRYGLGFMNLENPLFDDRLEYYSNILFNNYAGLGSTTDAFIPTMLELADELKEHGL